MSSVGIVGFGEVGSSIGKLYENNNIKCVVNDPYKNMNGDISSADIINICIPCQDKFKFISILKKTLTGSKCSLVIVHSSILLGIIEELKLLFPEKHIVHSPIRGVHPDLTKSTETFLKFIGSIDGDEKSLDAAEEHFNMLNIKCHRTSCKSTVLCKLLSTTYYGMCIAYTEHMGKIFDKYELDFKDVGVWTDSYNTGYTELGMLNVQRPNLYRIPGGVGIGGHCVVPNAILLKKMFPEINAWDYILQFK